MPSPRGNLGHRSEQSDDGGVYPGRFSRCGEWNNLKMSTQNILMEEIEGAKATNREIGVDSGGPTSVHTVDPLPGHSGNIHGIPGPSYIGESSFFKRPIADKRITRSQTNLSERDVLSTDIMISSDDEDTDRTMSRRDGIFSLLSDSENSPPKKRTVLSARNRNKSGQFTPEVRSKRFISIREKEELKEELKLKRKSHIRGLDIDSLYKKGKVNITKAKEDVEDLNGDQLVDMVTEQMAEVLRVAMTSSNLKGVFQKSLKLAAARSMGCIHALRERTNNTKSENYLDEIRSLKRG